ncbi:ABC transporter substrate-binding protein [Martelella mediterranea]|uniref:Carbohydrate ABC transporter substrate-binding protein (CUT1 family) n=1 Tax=Martelella mediterranea TaxID=293089 RepID=A0A4R3NHV0_9HYPH|nr:sugar ABC transporter substrate-binding protein [Martelella mediterranea]TCT33070.1 carbohydrate ABC transporter substrate-binding protein (CUT1 family) [Martelella mediterranea]
MQTRRQILTSSAALAATLALPRFASAAVSSDVKANLTTYNWGNPDEAQAYAAAFARFQERFPNVSVADNITPVSSWSDYADKLVTQIAGGNPPDIINIAIEGVRLAVDKGLLMPLDDLIAANPQARALLDTIPLQLRDALSVDGKLYEVPNGWQTMVIHYNKKVFDEAGVAYPKPGWTWDDFLDTAKALTKGEQEQRVYGFGMPWFNFAIHPWYLTNGTYPVSDDYTESNLTDPKMVEVAQWLHDLVHVHKVSPDPIGLNVYDQFAAGRFGMTGAGRWPVAGWVKNGFTDFDIVEWPRKAASATVFGGAGWGISPESKNPELAFKAIMELVSVETVTEVMDIGQQIPIYREVAESPAFLAHPENAELFYNVIETARPVASPKYFNALDRILGRVMDEVITNSKSPEDALASGDRELKRAIRRAG